MTPENFDLARFLPYQLAHLSERVSKRLSVIYEQDFGLSMAEWRVLVHVARAGSVSVREIHNCVNLEKSRVSRAVTRMQDGGLVKKVENADDHRLVRISLTPKGTEVYQTLIPLVSAVEARLLSDFTPEELGRVNAFMEKLHQALDADPLAKTRSSHKPCP